MIATNTSKKTHCIYLPIIVAVFLLFITIAAIAKEAEKIGGVDKNLCTSCGYCLMVDPNDIKWDSDGKAKVLNPIFDEQRFLEAKDACPNDALWSNF